ncbi:unnamed protein product [Durusdinium trenchii]|uniref:Uncharacterized protein n=1 Tax=Durusdinium trenchii TaxID=1381693 RepID=A0ABP0PS26_9DINO
MVKRFCLHSRKAHSASIASGTTSAHQLAMSRSPKRQLLRRTSIALLLLLSALQRRHGGPWPSSLAAPVTDAELLSTAEQRHVQRVVWRKSMAAIAEGKMRPGKELELISALDLGTIPWSHVPRRLKDRLALPLGDRGIDSLALNLTVAVQAKDYTNGLVPLNRLATFFFLSKASPLKRFVQQLVVATTAGTRLPEDWLRWSGAQHRKYRAEELEKWRRKALKQKPPEEPSRSLKIKCERWPHQIATRMLKALQSFSG